MSAPATSAADTSAVSASARLDPRGLRFAAAVTAVVLAIALVTASPVVLAVQAIVFAVGTLLGPRFSPYGLFYARVVRPRLPPPTELEDAQPPRFAQGVGLAFALIGLIAELAGLGTLAVVAISFALAAAFLNAAFAFCLGCQLYLLGRRVRSRPVPTSSAH